MISAILLNWKRDISPLIASIKKQSIPCDIIVWDNSGMREKGAETTLIRSDKNFGCYARWMCAAAMDTKYCFTIDDDFIITDTMLFEKLISESKSFNHIYMLAYNGCIMHDGDRPYWDGQRATIPKEYTIVNTGVSFFKTSLLNNLPFAPYSYISQKTRINPEEMKYADDIWISAFIHARVSEHIFNGVKSTENDEYGLSKQSPHMPARDEMCKRLFR